MAGTHFERPGTLTVTISGSGTPQRLSSSKIPCRSFMIQAKVGNAGTIYVADSAANCVAGRATDLSADKTLPVTGDAVSAGAFALLDLRDFWIDGTNNGDIISVIYLQDVTS
jgi:hypothetical protein